MAPFRLGRVDVLVGATDAAGLGAALALAGGLPGRGRKVELVASPERPGKIRKSADERKIPVAVWLGAGGQIEGVWVAEPLAARVGPVAGSAEGLASLLDKWDRG